MGVTVQLHVKHILVLWHILTVIMYQCNRRKGGWLQANKVEIESEQNHLWGHRQKGI